MSQDPPRDKIFALPHDQVSAFTFDENVARVFPDMINRSVPGYATVISVIGVIADHYAQADSQIYDLGCSLGAVTMAMARHVQARGIGFIAVDNSEAMIDRCSKYFAESGLDNQVEPVCARLQDIEIRDASVVVMNFTLQFIPPEERAEILGRIYEGLRPGGVLVLSEKISHPDVRIEADMVSLHHDFKRLNGYSDLEISQKRQALENVLIPETLETHEQRLRQAGFRYIENWFQCLNFASLLAVK
jgi:tRNA (cmo5U34)-methyltransferase